MFHLKARFTKPVIAVGLATAIAFSPATATPARAGTDPLGAVFGAGVLALVIGGIIAAETQNRGQVSYWNNTHPRRDDRRDTHRDSRRDSWRDDRRDDRRGPHDEPRVDRRKLLPSQCDLNVRHGSQTGTYYTKTCLMQNFRSWPMLPDRCETRLNTRSHGRVTAYDAQCLARYGYRDEHGRGQGRDIRARR